MSFLDKFLFGGQIESLKQNVNQVNNEITEVKTENSVLKSVNEQLQQRVVETEKKLEEKLARISVAGKEEKPVEKPNVDLYNKIGVGVQWTHPMQLFKDLQDENPWVDLASTRIAEGVTSATPTFSITSKNKKRKTALEKLAYLFENPNPDETGYELIFKVVKDLVDFGNSYWRIIYTMAGDIHSIYKLPPEYIWVEPYFEGNILRYKYYQSYPNVEVYDWYEVVHFKLPNNSKTNLYGKPVFYSNITNILADENVSKWVQKFFEQTYGGGLILKQDADPDTAERNRAVLDTKYSGEVGAGKIMLLEGNIDVEALPAKMAAFDYSKLKATSKEEILNHAGVPVSQAGVRSDSGNANAEVLAQEEKVFIRTIHRYTKIVYGTIEKKFFREILGLDDVKIAPGLFLEFNVKERIEQARAAAEVGARIGEIRTLLGLPLLDNEFSNNIFLQKTNNGYANAQLTTLYDLNSGELVSDELLETAAKARGGAGTKIDSNLTDTKPEKQIQPQE